MRGKKIQAVIIFLLFSFSIYAQEALNKGVYTLSGSATYSSIDYTFEWMDGTGETSFSTKQISVTPSLGYFIIDNLLITTHVSFLYSEFSGMITRNYNVGVGGKYYFRMNVVSPFVSAKYSYYNTTTGNNDANQFSFSGGVNYFLSKSVALEPFVEYSTRNGIGTTKEYDVTSFGIRVVYFVVD